MLVVCPDRGTLHFARLLQTTFRFVLGHPCQIDTITSVLQMRKLRFREINLWKILQLIIQQRDLNPGQIDFKSPLTNFRPCAERSSCGASPTCPPPPAPPREAAPRPRRAPGWQHQLSNSPGAPRVLPASPVPLGTPIRYSDISPFLCVSPASDP